MFKIKLARLLIGVDNHFPYMERFCKAYITEEPGEPVFTVAVTKEECLAEQSASPVPAGLPYCESLCLYRQIALRLIDHDAFLMHAAAIAVDGVGYLFAAKSGTGKTTHISLWQEAFGERMQVINGDKPILRFENGELRAYGTPFCGKERLGGNISAPVRALCFVTRDAENRIEPIPASQVLGRIFHQLLMPRDEEQMERFMALVERMLSTVDCYLLHCNMEAEAARVAYEGMGGR